MRICYITLYQTKHKACCLKELKKLVSIVQLQFMYLRIASLAETGSATPEILYFIYICILFWISIRWYMEDNVSILSHIGCMHFFVLSLISFGANLFICVKTILGMHHKT